MEFIPNEYVTEERRCPNRKGPQVSVREYFNRLLEQWMCSRKYDNASERNSNEPGR